MPTTPAPVTRYEFDAIIRRIEGIEKVQLDLEKAVEYHDKILITGNGELALREQVRSHGVFISENKGLPEEVRTQGRWIQNVNKLGWAIIAILLGILVTNGYGVFFKPPTP